ncbi:MAG: helix-turn-helix domain-containing protein [Desulfovibrio sp.]|jgi:transcriptional regulator with XRE-family HTH domain|nr:helix-turn-helix domain-containing protein [Desulfovibrio sp.]
MNAGGRNTQNSPWVQSVFDSIAEDEFIFDDITFKIISGLHDLIKQKDVTQKELAAKMGVSEAHVSKILSGDRNITLKTIAKLLYALDGDMQIKFTGKDGDWTWFGVYSNPEKQTWKGFDGDGSERNQDAPIIAA